MIASSAVLYAPMKNNRKTNRDKKKPKGRKSRSGRAGHFLFQHEMLSVASGAEVVLLDFVL